MRKLIFNTFADEYNKFRPMYPVGFINKISEACGLSRASVSLEIGCGSGQATCGFAKLGLQIDCVEPGAQLIEIAKRNLDGLSVRFFNSNFEDYNAESHSYDFIFSATAFHWVDPVVGYQKVHSLLKSNGHFCLIGLKRSWEAGLRADLDKVYAKYRGDFAKLDTHPKTVDSSVYRGNYFDLKQELIFEEQLTYDAESYTGLMKTMSDHRSLPQLVQGSLFEDIHAVVEKRGKIQVKNIYSAEIYKAL